MEDFVVLRGLSSLGAQDIQGWKDLFVECYKKPAADADAVFRKYMLHADRVWMCIARKEGRLVACYSGVALPFGQDEVFLSTDTMSNGQVSGATVKMAGMLYPALAEAGIGAVCGYPNANIVRIRERKLGWQMRGQLYFYVGLPLLWRLGRRKSDTQDLWNLRRPDRGFYTNSRAPLSLLGRDGPYEGGWLTATLSSTSPGPFFIRVPARLVAPKNFGYALISPDTRGLAARFENAARRLDLNTIDVP